MDFILRTQNQSTLFVGEPPSGYLENESQLPWTVGYIFGTAVQSQRTAEQLFGSKGRQGIASASKVLYTAGKTLDQGLPGIRRLATFTLMHDADTIEVFWDSTGMNRMKL